MRLEIRNFTQNKIDKRFFQKITEVVLGLVAKEKKTELGKLDNVEISLAFVGDGRMRKLNKIYRGHNRVTDVLSFGNKPIISYLTKAFPCLKKNQELEFIEVPDNIKQLGEIVICYSRAKKQAKRANHSLERELTILLVHGILHLLGYGHKEGEEAEEMERMEKMVSKSL